MGRRVVITGMGVVSPNGVGNAAFSEGILLGRSGVRRISRFDSAEIPVQIAGEVPRFRRIGLGGESANASMCRGCCRWLWRRLRRL